MGGVEQGVRGWVQVPWGLCLLIRTSSGRTRLRVWVWVLTRENDKWVPRQQSRVEREAGNPEAHLMVVYVSTYPSPFLLCVSVPSPSLPPVLFFYICPLTTQLNPRRRRPF